MRTLHLEMDCWPEEGPSGALVVQMAGVVTGPTHKDDLVMDALQGVDDCGQQNRVDWTGGLYIVQGVVCHATGNTPSGLGRRLQLVVGSHAVSYRFYDEDGEVAGGASLLEIAMRELFIG